MKLYDIIVKEKQQQRVQSVQIEETHSTQRNDDVLIADLIPTKLRKRKRRIAFFLFIVLFALLYSVGYWVSYAKITLYERTIPFTLTGTVFELSHEGSTERGADDYTFQTMTIESVIEREVIGTEFKQVSDFAQGTVVFSNTFGRSAETVRSGTIIESPSGKKYKTTAAISVPGYTLSGTERIPGLSNPVTVIAVEAGTASNNPGDTFVVPSFTATKRKAFFAKSVGPLVGGDSGARHSLPESEEISVIELLRVQLGERLRREARAQIPEEFYTTPDLQYSYISSDDFQLEGTTIKFNASAKGQIVSYLIKRDLIYALIAQEVLRDEYEGDFYISNLSDLKFQIISAVPSDPTTIPDLIEVSVTGSGVLTSRIDTEGFRSDIAGRSVKEFREYVSNKGTIEKAELSLLPFWAPNLSDSRELLKIVVR